MANKKATGTKSNKKTGEETRLNACYIIDFFDQLDTLGIDTEFCRIEQVNNRFIVDVYNDVNFSNKNLTDKDVDKIKFRRIYGDFNCSKNIFTSLDFCPRYISGDFDCSNNQLTSLENAPDRIDGDFDCSNNKIVFHRNKSLYVGGDFYCFGNPFSVSMAKSSSIVVTGTIYNKKLEELVDSKEYKKKLSDLKSRLIKMVKQKQLPRYLYKYRAIDENTKKIIINHEFYFNSPANFNDPYDCNIPKISTIEINNAEKSISKEETDVNKIIKHATVNPQNIKTALTNTVNKIGICCFSTVFDSILMWSHYADYHKGICLKFDILKDPDFFLNTLSVHYSQMQPYFDILQGKNDISEEIIRTKFVDWSYESEVRIVKCKKDIKNNNKKDDARLFGFNKEALVEIIFGEKTSEEDMNRVRKWCTEGLDKQNIRFSQMTLKKGTHYGLKNEELKNF